MRAFFAILFSAWAALWLTDFFGAPTTQSASGQNPMLDVHALRAGMKQIEDAMKDPEKGRLLQCLGGAVSAEQSWPAPNANECERILTPETAKIVTQNVSKGDSVRGSPAVRAYVELMLQVQDSLLLAFQAGICGLRSEPYFQVFKQAQFKISEAEAQRLNLKGKELDLADAEVVRLFAKARQDVPDFNVIDGCAKLRTNPKLARLDVLHQKWTANYH